MCMWRMNLKTDRRKYQKLYQRAPYLEPLLPLTPLTFENLRLEGTRDAIFNLSTGGQTQMTNATIR